MSRCSSASWPGPYSEEQVTIEVTDIRDYTHDAHGTADDYQFGGGYGMVMKPEPVYEATEAALSVYTEAERTAIPVIFLTPQGELLTQKLVEELSAAPAIALICGHYAGADERIAEGWQPARSVSATTCSLAANCPP